MASKNSDQKTKTIMMGEELINNEYIMLRSKLWTIGILKTAKTLKKTNTTEENITLSEQRLHCVEEGIPFRQKNKVKDLYC